MLCLNLEKKIKSNILIIRNINYLYFFIIFLILIMNYLNFEFESSDRVNSLIYIFFGFWFLPLIFCISSNLKLFFKKVDTLLGNLSYYVYLIHVFIYIVLIELEVFFFNEKFIYLTNLIPTSYIFFKLIDPIEKKIRNYFK